MKNKKAQTNSQFGVFEYMIVGVLFVIFCAGLIFAMGLINGVFHQVGVDNDKISNPNAEGYVNLTLASDNIFGKVNESIQALRMVALVYLLCMACLIMITNAFIKINSIYFFAYILICLLAVLFAPQISNAYGSLLNSGIFDGALETFSAPNFIILNFPIVVLVISVLGGVFLFINMIRNSGEGNLQ